MAAGIRALEMRGIADAASTSFRGSVSRKFEEWQLHTKVRDEEGDLSQVVYHEKAFSEPVVVERGTL